MRRNRPARPSVAHLGQGPRSFRTGACGWRCFATASSKTVADALGVSALTVSKHLELLEQANLVYKLPPLDIGGKKILKTRNKYYLADTALRNPVLLRGEEVLSSTDEMGKIVETTVLRHLFAYYYRDTPEIVYWRDPPTDKRVDIIVKSPSYTLPEVRHYSP